MINIKEGINYFRADIKGSRNLFIEINGNNIITNAQTDSEDEEITENLSEYIYECYDDLELQNNVGLITACTILDYVSIQYNIINGIIKYKF